MDSNKSIATELPKVDPEQIRPGEIWEISRQERTPYSLSLETLAPSVLMEEEDIWIANMVGVEAISNELSGDCLNTNNCQPNWEAARSEVNWQLPTNEASWEVIPHGTTVVGIADAQSDNRTNIDVINYSMLYPEAARSFFKGHSPPRYVMIVKEPEPTAEPQEEWRMVSVMLLSVKTDRVSDVDLLIPSAISEVGQDLLAETWHVLPMLTSNLSHPVGRRLSREIYDVLLDVGDYYHGLLEKPPTLKKIRSLGLTDKKVSAKQPKIQAFHQQEKEWAAVLEVPVAAYRTYLKTMKTAEAIFDRAVKLEQKFFEEKAIVSQSLVHLSQWFHKVVEESWHTVKEGWYTEKELFGRSIPIHFHSCGFTSDAIDEIAEIEPIANIPTDLDGSLDDFGSFWKTSSASSTNFSCAYYIDQLHSAKNELERQIAAISLGDIAKGNADAIEALTNLIFTTEDEKTLWVAAKSLSRLDPDNSVALQKGKLIELGQQPHSYPFALIIALIQKTDGHVSISVVLHLACKGIYFLRPLLPALKLTLLDEVGRAIREVEATHADSNYLELRFSGLPGEQFSVRIALDYNSITEKFLI